MLSFNEELKQKLKRIPQEPGVYLMKDKSKKIIYVGKAKNTRSRLRSYFQITQDPKTHALVKEIADFDIMIVASEVEALLLERTLIKHHKPRYNILLRDDKDYPYVRVDIQNPWPRIKKVRRKKDDDALYLGPFSQVGSLHTLLSMMSKIFPLIRCSEHEFANATRPCNYYHMRRCLGPCTLPVDPKVYQDMIKNAVSFLQGKNKEVLKSLKGKMQNASDAEDFETAVLYRDQMNDIQILTQDQHVIVDSLKDCDVLGLYQHESQIAFHVLMVREGRLIGQDSFVMDSLIQTQLEACEEFLIQYYEHRDIPPEIILENFSGIEQEAQKHTLEQFFLQANQAKATKLHTPNRGSKKKLLLMAKKNAEYALREAQHMTVSKPQVNLQWIQEKLNLTRLPQRVECIDISNIQGSAIVASQVCFIDGRPAKEHYRIFNLSDFAEGPNDFLAMKETVLRRLKRAQQDRDAPDLLVIDGGKGQLSAAIEAYQQFSDLQIDVISLAKSRVSYTQDDEISQKKEERVFFSDQEEPMILEIGSPQYRLLTSIRDEAHRFAIKQHRRRRKKILHSSWLDKVAGIGPVLKKRLFERFHDLEGLKKASVEELCQVKGMNVTKAQDLWDLLKA